MNNKDWIRRGNNTANNTSYSTKQNDNTSNSTNEKNNSNKRPISPTAYMPPRKKK